MNLVFLRIVVLSIFTCTIGIELIFNKRWKPRELAKKMGKGFMILSIIFLIGGLLR